MFQLLRATVIALACFAMSCAECKVNADCPAGNICFARACRPFSGQIGCTGDDECEPGTRCVSNSCVRTSVACEEAATCRSGEACTNNRCVNAALSCESDQDCDLGVVCELNQCSEDLSCDSDFDCDDEAMCEDNRCQIFDCFSSDDCLRGECIDDTCRE